MWLINVDTLELEEFIGSDIPLYAILSHTWGEEEVSFADWQQPEVAKKKKGYSKILSMCRITKSKYNLQYAWVDTNCIDKRSSAELSESINSMFRWYKNAVICIVYLSDVASLSPESENAAVVEQQFCRSRWFTRGWTLQELLAPRHLYFFSESWHYLWNRRDRSTVISAITRIPKSALLGLSPLTKYPVAQRMSWASKRQTTRIEDEAYCLMGLFDVNIPLLYGEGNKAFQRLQEEIMRASNDLSILAWRMDNVGDTLYQSHNFLAPSALNFDWVPNDLVRMENLIQEGKTGDRLHTSMTNVGLRLPARVISTHCSTLFIIPLPFSYGSAESVYEKRVCLFVWSDNGVQFWRAQAFCYPQFLDMSMFLEASKRIIYLGPPYVGRHGNQFYLPTSNHRHQEDWASSRSFIVAVARQDLGNAAFNGWKDLKGNAVNSNAAVPLLPLIDSDSTRKSFRIIELLLEQSGRRIFLVVGHTSPRTPPNEDRSDSNDSSEDWTHINPVEGSQKIAIFLSHIGSAGSDRNTPSIRDTDGVGVWKVALVKNPSVGPAADRKAAWSSRHIHVAIQLPQWQMGPDLYETGIPLISIIDETPSD